MNDHEFESGMQNLPLEPDEGWWAAVLADEPSMDHGDQAENHELILNDNSIDDGRQTSSVNWERIRQIYINDEIVELSVVGYNRGGLLVAGEDIHGFVPASHLIDIPSEVAEEEREHYFTSYLDRNISLKIIECERDKERIVFSERAALAGQGQRKHLLSCLKEGDVVKGIVTNVTEFGVFVDLGGLEGLIHVSELSWGRVQHPSDILNVGMEIQSIVLQVSEDKGRIALSYKRMEDNPWDVLAQSLNPGDLVPAVITSIVKYGAFARLEEGIEGLIHISSMNFPNGCTHIDDFLFEGQDVNVSVLHIDSRKRRLGLKLESYSVD
jgi:small subunit ribosomal protein S1